MRLHAGLVILNTGSCESMSWIPLRDRLSHLPLILAGPILRRTEPQSVTVWLALKQPCEVTLQVFATVAGEGLQIQGGAEARSPLLQGTHATVAIGQYLHLVAVTAQPIDHTHLVAGQVYVYDLQFRSIAESIADQSPPQTWTLQEAINNDYVQRSSISYFDHQLPSFVLPADDLNHLQLVHGSCRKPHGADGDALAILDDLIQQNCTQPNNRPQQLFLTGDQIYGDDVADPMLMALTAAANTLLGWEEQLPLDQNPGQGLTESSARPIAPAAKLRPQDLLPGQRSQVAEELAGLTATLYNQPERGKSHLFGFGEYCAMYLFAWSPTLWSLLPEGREVYNTRKAAKAWDQEVADLERFARSLSKVQRLLANVATYMICDDHDISDDWYLNQEWCLRVLSRPLGRRVVQNGLLAYALFQAWGNTPEQFITGRSGGSLLAAASAWSASGGTDTTCEAEITRYLGLPKLDADGKPLFCRDGHVWILDRAVEALEWNYVVRGLRHEVIVLDTRTWRGYPMDPFLKAPPMLLSPTAFDRQLRQPMQDTDTLKQAGKSQIAATLVVAPTNLVSLRAIDWIQHWNLKQGKVFDNDVGDAWNIHKYAFAVLLKTLFERRDRLVILSGDIHYGSTVCLHYWSQPDRSSGQSASNQSTSEQSAVYPDQPHVLAQLTSSALKNTEWKTRIVHTKVKSLVPEPPQDWIGWNDPLRFVRVRPGLKKSKLDTPPDWRYRSEWIKRQPLQTAFVRPSRTKPESGLKRLGNWFANLLWNNRWLQEGAHVVGLSNLGVVRFQAQSLADAEGGIGAVTHDLYWHAPWQHNTIVFSRFDADLELEAPPRL